MSKKVPITVPLGTPIQAHGEEVKQLTIRPPTGRGIQRCGFIADANGRVNTKVVGEYISELAGIPPASVNELEGEDFLAAMAAVCGFFGGFPTTS